MTISVLKLTHRKKRDIRITTHCALVSRAFGADEFLFGGEKDESIIKTVEDVVKKWGGDFKIKYVKSWRRIIKETKAKIVHLTMYGEELDKALKEIKKFKNLLIIVGGEKVPREVYELADYNVSVTSQPHSEVASIAVFLDHYFNGKELYKEFKNAKIKIIPQKKGKKVLQNE